MPLEAIGRPMEILLVEDSLMAARLTMGALTNSGIEHRLTWLSNGAEAKRFLLQEDRFARAPRPDLVLLDLNLPSLDGRSLLKEIRASRSLQGIPVVIMTGDSEDTSGEFAPLDVQGFLVKPIDLDRFLALMEELKDFWKIDMIIGRKE